MTGLTIIKGLYERDSKAIEELKKNPVPNICGS